MAAAYAKVEGLEKLQRALKEAPRKTRALLRDMLEESANAVAASARGKVARHEGDLYRAIAVSGRGMTWRAGLEDMSIGSRRGSASHINPSIYGRFVEYGTSRTGARPFMKPAAEGEANQITGRLRKVAAAIPGEL